MIQHNCGFFFNWNQCRATIQKDIFLIHMNFLRNLHFTNDTHPTVLSQLFINSISKIIIRTINIFDGKIFKLIIIIFSTLKMNFCKHVTSNQSNNEADHAIDSCSHRYLLNMLFVLYNRFKSKNELLWSVWSLVKHVTRLSMSNTTRFVNVNQSKRAWQREWSDLTSNAPKTPQ